MTDPILALVESTVCEEVIASVVSFIKVDTGV
jgi:hypothetical protein